MSATSIIINYGGRWLNDKYEGGERRFLLVPPTGITYSSLFSNIEGMGVDKQVTYSIHSVIRFGNVDGVRMDIMNDIDLKFVMDRHEVPEFFVTTSPTLDKSPSYMWNSSVVEHSFVGLLNAQSSQFPHSLHGSNNLCRNQATNEVELDFATSDEHDDDGSEGDEELIYDDGDSSDGFSTGTMEREDEHELDRSSIFVSSDQVDLQNKTSEIRQWVIAGAQYHASFPVEDCRYKEQYTRDGIYHGAIFSDKESMLISLGLYHLLNRVQYVVERSSKTRFAAVCKFKDQCKFLIRATCYGSMWRVIKWQDPHTCLVDLRHQGNRTVSSKVIGAFFAPNLYTDGAVLKPKEMASQLQRQYGFQIDYSVALAGRNHAINMVYGEPCKSFQLLPKYLYMIQQANPGSTVNLQTTKSGCFQYAFMAIDACVHGFLSAGRPVIVVDGTHLKGKYKGVLFVATTKDGNEQVFPLAVGLGDKENDKSWTWFFSQLRRTFGCPKDLLIISDQHRSIKNAVEKVYPGVPHGVCVYHLQKNISKHGPRVIAMFLKAANCYSSHEYDNVMRNLSSEDNAFKRLMEIKPCRWARSQCAVRRYGFMTSNCAESFNGRLLWARRLPVCTLLECVRTVISHWFVERRDNASRRTHELTEYAHQKLDDSIEEGRTMNVEPINTSRFKVSSRGVSFIVDLSERRCSCKEFDLDLIPCPHAAAAICTLKQSCVPYVSTCYTMDALRSMYSKDVNPTPHPSEWQVPSDVESIVVGVPTNPRQAGRPRTKRIEGWSRSLSRSRRSVCSRCLQIGHYRSSCTVNIPIPCSERSDEYPASKRRKSCGICHNIGHNRRKCPSRKNSKA